MISTHGRSGIGRLLYGSVAHAVLRVATLPVMHIPPNLGGAWPRKRPPRSRVPLDGSQLAEAVLGPAAELAARLGAELLLVDVVHRPPIVYDDRIELLAYTPTEQLAEALGYLSDVAARLCKSGASAPLLIVRPTEPQAACWSRSEPGVGRLESKA